MVRFVITVTRGRWTRRMRVRSFVGAGLGLPARGAVPRLAGRPYLPSFALRRESRLDPEPESGVTASDWIPSTQLTLTKMRDRTYESEH